MKKFHDWTKNKQNDRVYGRTSYGAQDRVSRVQQGHYPTSIVVWRVVFWKGVICSLLDQKPPLKFTTKLFSEQ